MYISLWILLRIRNVPESRGEKQNAHFTFSENLACCGIMWKNRVQSDKPQMTVCCMHFPSWVLKAYRYTLRICNIYWFFTTSMFTQARRNVTSYVSCLSCLVVYKTESLCTVVYMYTTWLVGVVSKLQADRPTNRDVIPGRAKDFSSTQMPKRGLRPTLISVRLILRVKLQGAWSSPSTPYSAEIKTEWSHISTLLHAFMTCRRNFAC
jgi:hypothetical protein